jgi:hypothetical protein
MKRILLLAVIVMSGMTLLAQETFFPTKVGTVLVYQTTDKKGKISGSFKYTIKDVNVMGQDLDITYLIENMGAKDELVYKEEVTIHQRNGVIDFDMSSFINKGAFQQNGEIPSELTITGNSMEVPLNPEPGMTMPDAHVEMAMSMGFVKMKMLCDVTNRKVEAIEDATVKAGTFKCYIFSSDVNATALGIKTQSKSKEWYARGIGTIKTEAYDKNGKLLSTTELIELTK